MVSATLNLSDMTSFELELLRVQLEAGYASMQESYCNDNCYSDCKSENLCSFYWDSLAAVERAQLYRARNGVIV